MFKGMNDEPTMPNIAVKMLSTKALEKLEIKVAHPRASPAAAGLGQVGLVTKAGDVLLSYPQHPNYSN